MKRLAFLVVVLTLLGLAPRLWQRHVLATTAHTVPQVRAVHPSSQKSAPLGLPGTLQAIQQATVSTRSSGTVQRRLVDIGDKVKQGQLLAEIAAPEVDSAFYQADAELAKARAGTLSAEALALQQGALARQAQASVAQAQARVAQSQADLAGSQRSLGAARHTLESQQAALVRAQSALNLAEKTWKRWDELARDGAVTQQDADNQRAAWEQAQASVDAARAAVGVAQEEVLSRQSAVTSAQAGVTQAQASASAASEGVTAVVAAQSAAQANLQAARATESGSSFNRERQGALRAFAEVRAPFDGVITSRSIDAGSLVKGDSTPPTALFGLSRTDVMRALVAVPQTYAGILHEGDEVEVRVREFAQPFAGKVFRVAGGLDELSRTVQVEVHIPNQKGVLKSGMYAETAFEVASPGLVVPSTALVFGAQGTRAALVVDGKVHFVPVRVGRDMGKLLVVDDGLRETDLVVANPSQDLAEGTAVGVLKDAPQVQGKAR